MEIQEPLGIPVFTALIFYSKIEWEGGCSYNYRNEAGMVSQRMGPLSVEVTS